MDRKSVLYTSSELLMNLTIQLTDWRSPFNLNPFSPHPILYGPFKASFKHYLHPHPSAHHCQARSSRQPSLPPICLELERGRMRLERRWELVSDSNGRREGFLDDSISIFSVFEFSVLSEEGRVKGEVVLSGGRRERWEGTEGSESLVNGIEHTVNPFKKDSPFQRIFFRLHRLSANEGFKGVCSSTFRLVGGTDSSEVHAV